ncbi:MAG TPA: cytochrome c [Polyangiales bacterium]|nr:cytochrome c [Polyangiales bacterium]
MLASGLVLTLVAACGASRQSPPVQSQPTQLTAEERAGQRVFMRECNGCHPQGDGGLGPALNDKPVPVAAIKLQVREGLGAMPSFSESEISSDELSALVAFLSAKGSPWGG